jgi:hypothetical protein
MPYLDSAARREQWRRWNEQNRAKRSRMDRSLRGRIQELKGRVCMQCGFEAVTPQQLHWHHRDPSTKAFNVSRWTGSPDNPRLLAEIAKCDVLCANCHALEHHG